MLLDEVLRRLADFSSDALIVLGRWGANDSLWRVVHVNTSFEGLTGYALAELVGHPPAFLEDDDEPAAGAFVQAALDARWPATLAVTLTRRDRTRAPATLALTPMSEGDLPAEFWV